MTLTEFNRIFDKIIDKYSSTHARNSNNSRRSPFQPHLVDITISADTGMITEIVFKDIYSPALSKYTNEQNEIVFREDTNKTIEEQINNFFEELENEPTD